MAEKQVRRKRVKSNRLSGDAARTRGHRLTMHGVGALPLLNQVLEGMKLEEFLRSYLPREDRQTTIPTARVLLVLVRNFLLSRDPVYGVGEWAAGFPPELLELTGDQLPLLNDDRVGRCLERPCQSDYRLGPSISGLCTVMGVAGTVIIVPHVEIGHPIVLGVMATIGMLLLFFLVTRPLTIAFPHGVVTVGDLATSTLPPGFEDAAKQEMTDQDVWEKLQKIMANYIGVDISKVTPSARFVEDLGAE